MSHMTQEFSDSCWVRKARNLGNQLKWKKCGLQSLIQVWKLYCRFLRDYFGISQLFGTEFDTKHFHFWVESVWLLLLISCPFRTSTCSYSWWLSGVPFCLRMAHGRLAQFRQELRHDLALLAGSDQGLEGKWEWGWADYSIFLICQVPRCSKYVDYSPVFTYMKGENWPHEQRGNGL